MARGSSMTVEHLPVLEYELRRDGHRMISIQRCDGSSLWAVRCSGFPVIVLTVDGEWEWEVSPSALTPDDVKRTRFTTAEEAYAFWYGLPEARRAPAACWHSVSWW